MFKNKSEESSFPPHGDLVARAKIKGTTLRPNIRGEARFYQAGRGCVVQVEVEGLPAYQMAVSPNASPIGAFFGFHIHERSTCGMEGNQAGGHYNPGNQPHGNHAGDLPSLLENDGRAMMSVYTNRFTPKEVIGRTVMIHENPDDYRTQPSGNSGARIACGSIEHIKKI